ncbi:MAG TPA: hypothetical protein VH353_07735 [Caulobacteraceae bacterium]|jgi:hypothetical protein|nr:hypothetical protein [Caulobacteraceae bacterium]
MALYEHLMIEIAGGPQARAAVVDRLGAWSGADKPLGLFTSQLGWAASEAAILIEDGEGAARDAADALARQPGLTLTYRRLMRPTLRPADGARLAAGGVWVHRTFEIRTENLQTFVALSGEGWADFERRFDARVFGLFEVTEPRPDPAVTELLLMTRYGSHGIWEDSRDPTTEAMQTFLRRAALTLRTRAASSLLAWAAD